MRFDVTLPGSRLRFTIEASDDREAVNTALLIAREEHRDVKVHASEDGRLVADTSDDRAVPVEHPRHGSELAPAMPTSSPETPEKG